MPSLNAIFASQILSFTGGQTHQYGDPSISKRLNFIGDPKQGDASISLSDVRQSDTATYQCKVKKAPGVDMRKVTLVVMGEEKFLFYRFYLFIVSFLFLMLLSLTWNEALSTPPVSVSEHTFLCSQNSDCSPLSQLQSSHDELKH